MRRNITDWHPWFAWYPVEVKGETTQCLIWVWLERIERSRGTFHRWLYRFPTNSS